ncbi:secretion system protein [Streptomyces kaniharaensis]|uniref:Secretion system protein n=1 Tax=Streptomyces kaniharaensis TaxID=212423 RepID=A0A6N7L4H6_9ACTN|nr:type II secretion system F family protein [Streptomyces kaniharaensis]MQS17538.1 secretion system protein [Streptomyces kaniharaensis]
MTPDVLLAAVGGTVAVLGIALAVAGAVGTSAPPVARPDGLLKRRLRTASAGLRGRGRFVLTAAGIAGLAVWLFSSWMLGGLLTAAAVVGMPWILQPGRGSKSQIKRLEALEQWVRRLSDIHTAGTSLEAAVTASLRSTPPALVPEISRLTSRLGAGWQPTQAYRAFAAEMDDATADAVAALMIGHVEDRGAGLSRALGKLADQVAEEVRMREKVEADREKPRANARWVALICLGVFALSVLSGKYVQPYSTPFGHLFLLGLAAAFAGVLVWMRRMSLSKPAPRFLAAPAASREGETR